MQRHNKEARQRFGEWLDITLDNRGIQGRTLAEQTGVDDSTVSRWRAGASLPSMDIIVRMAAFLGLNWQRLALTATLIPQDTVPDLEPYPMPQPTARRESVKRQIARIRGLSDVGRDRLLATYDEVTRGEFQ